MEKCVGDIQLANMPMLADCEGKEETNSSDLNDMTKGFTVINAFFLVKAFSNETGFVLGRFTV